jgi:hypothetical protein
MEKVYISENDLNNNIRAHRFEKEGKWEEARYIWQRMGYKEYVKAIDTILEATSKGDRFRELTGDAKNDLEDRKINIYQYNEILNNAHKEVYGH